MTPSAAAELKLFIHEKADPQKVYLLAITVPPAPGNISGEQVARVRLIPPSVRWRYVGRVCERLEPQPEACGLSLEGLPWRIHRGERENDHAGQTDPRRRNLTLVKLDMAERGPKPCLMVTQGEALTGLGNHAARGRNFSPGDPSGRADLDLAARGLLWPADDARPQSGRPASADQCLRRGPESLSPRRAVAVRLGGYMQAQNQLDLSAHAYRMAAQFGEIDPEPGTCPTFMKSPRFA